MASPVGITLEKPALRHQDEFLRATRRSLRLHRPWVHPPRTEEQYRHLLRRLRRRANFGHFLRMSSGELAGAVVLTEIVRGGFQSAYVGYYAFLPHAGSGLMRRGLELVIRHAFRELKLHRLEANIQPENERSIALIRRLGFTREGYSSRYLKIAGRWRDHERWALTIEDWKGRKRR